MNQVAKDLVGIFALGILVLGVSCQPEEEIITNDPSIRLRFSQDTLLFDTIFTSTGSITRRVKVYNERNNAIEINSVSLGGGQISPYTIFVNGQEGKSFSNQVLFGKDSMLILVEVLINPNSLQTPFVVEDSIIFETSGSVQNIKLLAWGQNANFLNDSIIACNVTWDNSLPYVIINSALVNAGCTLTVEPGAKIYFHRNSALFVGGSLIVSGASADKVLFINDRLDAPYNETPGQWEGIIFLEGSANNNIDHAIIRNAENGIWLGTPDDDVIPDLELSNTIIENMSNSGIIAFTSDLNAYNVVINNCGEFTLANLAGGNYTYEHLTLANMGLTFFRNLPSVVFTDYLDLSDGSTISADLNVSMVNSIVWGNLSNEIDFDLSLGNASFSFHDNLLKVTVDTFSVHNLINLDPRFLNPQVFNYKIDSLSPAIDKGIPGSILIDIDGNLRGLKPDLGAYEVKN